MQPLNRTPGITRKVLIPLKKNFGIASKHDMFCKLLKLSYINTYVGHEMLSNRMVYVHANELLVETELMIKTEDDLRVFDDIKVPEEYSLPNYAAMGFVTVEQYVKKSPILPTLYYIY